MGAHKGAPAVSTSWASGRSRPVPPSLRHTKGQSGQLQSAGISFRLTWGQSCGSATFVKQWKPSQFWQCRFLMLTPWMPR